MPEGVYGVQLSGLAGGEVAEYHPYPRGKDYGDYYYPWVEDIGHSHDVGKDGRGRKGQHYAQNAPQRGEHLGGAGKGLRDFLHVKDAEVVFLSGGDAASFPHEELDVSLDLLRGN